LRWPSTNDCTTWNATFTVAGIQIPLEPINNTYGPIPVDVRTARSQLVANDLSTPSQDHGGSAIT
jgi:hypothetical protein